MRILVVGMGRSIKPGATPLPLDTPAEAQQNSAMLGSYARHASPGTQIDIAPPIEYAGPDPDPGTGGTDRHLRWYMSIPAIVQKTVWAEQNGYDAVIQSNNFEHGVEAARLAVKIPVLGLCRTTMLLAANFADRIGVTVPLDGYFVLARHVIESHGLERFVSGMRSLSFEDVPAPEMVDTLRPLMYERTIEVMRGLVKDTGAECIVPLGGAVIPSVLDPDELTRQVGVTVFNPRAVGVRMAELCVNLGITQSPLTYTRGTLLS